jgi:hypothetical protein
MKTNKIDKPRFVIGDSPKSRLITKSKYSTLTKLEKLQMFVELACQASSSFVDVSDPQNQKYAEEWLNSELTFLGKRDVEELRRIWDSAVEDGGQTRMLFSAIKALQEKYA